MRANRHGVEMDMIVGQDDANILDVHVGWMNMASSPFRVFLYRDGEYLTTGYAYLADYDVETYKAKLLEDDNVRFMLASHSAEMDNSMRAMRSAFMPMMQDEWRA